SFMDDATDLAADVDSVPIQGLDVHGIYRVQSPLFDYTLPPDNVLRITGGGSSCAGTGGSACAVSDGYWLMLAPLSSGQHTIHFHGSLPAFNFALDVVYNLTVAS